ncbi:MAG: hypothetical protein WAQ98_23400 [Blastocatellia bacterium]
MIKIASCNYVNYILHYKILITMLFKTIKNKIPLSIAKIFYFFISVFLFSGYLVIPIFTIFISFSSFSLIPKTQFLLAKCKYENYGYGKESEYQEKITMLKNHSIYGLSKYDLFWLADKFARVFARVKGTYDYYHYHKYFFLIFFGKEKKKYPDNLFWSKSYCKRLEQKALEKANPECPIFFHSGNSAANDFLGHSMAKKPIGVQIQLCSENVKKLMLNYNAQEGRLFIDSGAFSAFRKGEQVDFDKVIKAYEFSNAEWPTWLFCVGPF